MVKNIVEALVHASEKSANIARVCRKDEHLFPLLIEEKSGEESNARFVHDFKTLADVLIQETVRHDICKSYPSINIQGEESISFTNGLGESINIVITGDEQETIECLTMAMDGNRTAAEILAAEVHRNVVCEHGDIDKIPDLPESFDLLGVGVWIDPIDATQEYIKGETHEETSSIAESGLECVTDLMGLYDKGNGKPLAGVINQPFYQQTETG